MTDPLRIRTPKEIIAANIELLPEADLWRPIIEQADEDGFLPSLEIVLNILRSLGIDPLSLRLWAKCAHNIKPLNALFDVAKIHEYWVSQQPDA